MKRPDVLDCCHPLTAAVYFLLVLGFSMFFMHPVSLCVSLGCALAYAVRLNGGRAVRSTLRYLLPMAAVAAVVNAAFNHEGATILAYLPSGNPLTLESIACGVAAAALLAAVVVWFSCLSSVMTADKLMYLLGRAIPFLSLLLSMALRFVPRFLARFREVAQARRCLEQDGAGLTSRVKSAVSVLSAVVSWSMENAIETADSMKSRGYGLPGRTAFSIYQLDSRDKAVLTWLCLCGGYVLFGWLAGGLGWRYYPTVRGTASGALPVSFQLAYLALCLTPILLNAKEDGKWTCSRSGI